MCKVLCFKDAPRGHYGPNPRGSIKRASPYPRPDEERGGDLYRSERSERRSDSDSPKQPNPLRNGDVQIFVGWVGGTPDRFLFLCGRTGSLSYSVWRGLRGRPFFFALLCSVALFQLVALIA